MELPANPNPSVSLHTLQFITAAIKHRSRFDSMHAACRKSIALFGVACCVAAGLLRQSAISDCLNYYVPRVAANAITAVIFTLPYSAIVAPAVVSSLDIAWLALVN